ncbi:hypothetical protein JD844_015060 [Phrynosoma platyrhinos]|uniref:Coiled-coil domain-containing protein 157 n=1 Tax=Phrynosoma platyrhinos TaxID=52577 RepID=A0ABQ7T781_PHRPL|nr:hypothetical protein JD844_015060 [Phrynosoma platyrhinos]
MVGLPVSRDRMESLQEDIVDLQGMVVTVFSQAGAVRYPSWKFPDKISCDLDLVPLLDRYGLLLLLQSFTEYAGNLISEEVTPPSTATGPSMSVGLAVRKYWESMVKVGALYQQLANEKKGRKDRASIPTCSSQASQIENVRTKSSCSERSESDVTILGLQASSLALSTGSGLLCGNPSARFEAKSTPGPDRPVQSIPSQMAELSPVPCDTCEKSQLSLREVGRAIVSICTSQNLPSSLSRFLKMLEETLERRPLTAVDISYWASEQNKDLSRINKHLQALTELITPLKEELEASQEQKEEMRKQIEAFEGRLQKEKEAQEQQRKQAGLLFDKRHQEILQMVAQLEKEKEDLQNNAVSLNETISTLKEKLQSQGATIQELEQAKRDLLQEMRMKMVDKAEVQSREEQLEVLTSQLEASKQQLGWATSELNKEKAKVESMLRNKESLQAKQRALMQQLDCLDQECEQLRASLADREEECILMKESLKEMKEGRWETQRQLEDQQKLMEKAEQEKLSMEQSASELQRTISELGELIQEMKERERLLVFFPDLHVPSYERKTIKLSCKPMDMASLADCTCTGNILEDMGKQIQANNIRISILEEQNARLRTAVAKMKETALLQEGAKLIPPTQLWIQSATDDSYEEGGTRSPTRHPIAAGIQGVAMRHPSHHANAGSIAQSRTQSSRGAGSSSTTSQRTLGNPLAKPPSREAAWKPPFTFTYEDVPYARVRGKGKDQAHSAHCTRNYQK